MDHNWLILKDLKPNEPSESLKSKIKAHYVSEKLAKPQWLDQWLLWVSPLMGRSWLAPAALAACIGVGLVVGSGLWFQSQDNLKPYAQSTDPLAQEQTIDEMEFILGL
jgi:hypothetical protein